MFKPGDRISLRYNTGGGLEAIDNLILDKIKNVDFVIKGTNETNLFHTEYRLRSVVEDVLEIKQENDLLKRFAQSLLERLYDKGE